MLVYLDKTQKQKFDNFINDERINQKIVLLNKAFRGVLKNSQEIIQNEPYEAAAEAYRQQTNCIQGGETVINIDKDLENKISDLWRQTNRNLDYWAKKALELLFKEKK